MTVWNCWMREGGACQAAHSIPHLSVICWSHTLSRRSGDGVYICLRCAGWWQGVKSAAWELSDVPVCAPIKSTWDSCCSSYRPVQGGELKEQTRRQRPLTDLTSVIRVLRCQRANQIKMNGAYPGPLEARLIGPNFISASNCSYRKINRASDHVAVRGENTPTYKYASPWVKGSYYDVARQEEKVEAPQRGRHFAA